jgi:V/A-type H+-transporting ATPase subunit I
VILPMAKVRLLGPRERLDDTLRVLQDFGRLHLADSTSLDGVTPVPAASGEVRRVRQLRRILEDVEAALAQLKAEALPGRGVAPAGGVPGVGTLARWARTARRARRAVDDCDRRQAALEEESALLHKYRDVLDALRPLLARVTSGSRLAMHAAVVPASERPTVERLVHALEEPQAGAGAIVALTHPLRDGDLALLLVMPASMERRIERLLADARVPELALPASYTERGLAHAVPAMLERLAAIPAERTAIVGERRDVAREHGPTLVEARAGLYDLLATREARAHCGVTARTFAIDGWLPADDVAPLRERCTAQLGPEVVVHELAREEWRGEEGAPVVLHNPRLFRPFEAIVGMMPLPHYGSIDPTPFVAVFFPMFFGLIVGDVGYGAVLLALALLLRRRGRRSPMLASVAGIAIPCALFAIAFGIAFGEAFGDLGRDWVGMRPVVFDREHAIFAFLGVAVALGVVHILLGLVLGVFTAWRHERRHAIGSGLSALMLILVVLALLALFEVLPAQLLSPAVIALLVAFPLLIAAEGIIAPLELLSTIGNVLSYARLMALGTASVMLAVVANNMAGAVGSAVVGALFALLFHLVNFAIALFSPTIHALRLHYVEFFGKFYSPGGTTYLPFGHWRAAAGTAAPGPVPPPPP